MTLRELKPSHVYDPVHITVEHLGKRFLITHITGFWNADKIALDFQKAFPCATYFTGDNWDSTGIDGNARDFRKSYKGDS